MDDARGGRRRAFGYVAAWVVAATVAVTVGVFAVTSLGASVRDRGPIGGGQDVVDLADVPEGAGTPDPDAARTRDAFPGEYGTFVVECRGAYAVGVEHSAAAGWRTVSFEEGPDDDIDVVFSSGSRSVEVEVYCNGGRPTVSDREVKTLPDSD